MVPLQLGQFRSGPWRPNEHAESSSPCAFIAWQPAEPIPRWVNTDLDLHCKGSTFGLLARLPGAAMGHQRGRWQ